MNDNELRAIWQNYDEKLNHVLSLNERMVQEMTRNNLRITIGRLRRPKIFALLLGIPFALLLIAITVISIMSGSFFQIIGFGAITVVTLITIGIYIRHLHLIAQINGSEQVADVQRKLASLKLSSYKGMRIAIFQLPFWSICWMSMQALIQSPFVYGGINLLVFMGLVFIAWRVYLKIDPANPNSRVFRFLFSGNEWDSLVKAGEMVDELDQLKDGNS